MLAIKIVTPDGVALRETGVAHVVLHRREPAFPVGSEIAIYPKHAPMLLRLPIAPARIATPSGTRHLALAGGFAQFAHDRLLIVTSRCEAIAAASADPRGAAHALCAAWRAAPGDEVGALAGYG